MILPGRLFSAASVARDFWSNYGAEGLIVALLATRIRWASLRAVA